MKLNMLPSDAETAILVGRAWHANRPRVVLVRRGTVLDITALACTVSDLLDRQDLPGLLRNCEGISLGPVDDWIQRSLEQGDHDRLLAPCDLQPVKACGVTFAVSLLERVIEEKAGGDPRKATALRAELQRAIGGELRSIVPGSREAERLKDELMARDAWSQYLEVGLGPDAEVFTKATPMAAVGFGCRVGLLARSNWNNPEPEVVLAVNSRLEIVGATLGNDVNLRDIEGRSALLLGKAKDNNGSCAIGPFIRVFDDAFSLDAIRRAKVSLRIEGATDGFVLEDASFMSEISRDPVDLVHQAAGADHQYPDGFMLFLGTMFSPAADRDAPGLGFTHKLGDRVTISTPGLGALVNEVGRSDQIPPWTFGIRSLYRSLAAHGSAHAPDRESPAGSSHAVYPSLMDKRVVITGGASGIGATLVEGFARQGAEVIFLDIADETGRALEGRERSTRHPPRFIHCDLTDVSVIQRVFATIEQASGPIDVLINNAANDDRHSVGEVTPEYWDERIAVNLRHQFFCAQAAAQSMRRRRAGVILNFGSISWHVAMANLSIYMTAKAGIEAMTRGLARELGEEGVRVNCIVPGAVRTERQTKLWRSSETDAQIIASQCLKVEIEPAHVTAMALFLASADAAGCSGRNYFVDGGMYGT